MNSTTSALDDLVWHSGKSTAGVVLSPFKERNGVTVRVTDRELPRSVVRVVEGHVRVQDSLGLECLMQFVYSLNPYSATGRASNERLSTRHHQPRRLARTPVLISGRSEMDFGLIVLENGEAIRLVGQRESQRIAVELHAVLHVTDW